MHCQSDGPSTPEPTDHFQARPARLKLHMERPISAVMYEILQGLASFGRVGQLFSQRLARAGEPGFIRALLIGATNRHEELDALPLRYSQLGYILCD